MTTAMLGSNARWIRAAIIASSSIIVVYHYVSAFYFFETYHAFLNKHLAAALIVVFLLELEKDGGRWHRAINLGLLLVAVVAPTYTTFQMDHLQAMGGAIDEQDAVFGAIYILIVLEAARRAWGPILPGLSALFILYFMFGHFAPGPFRTADFYTLDIIGSLSIGFSSGSSGLINPALNAGASFIIYFAIFGGVLKALNLDRLFMELGRLAGQMFSGGPGQTAVVASSLLGTVTGGAVANVAITGTFTIPMMKRSGYRADIAGAIEAAASTGANLVPPILGTAAFLMVALTGIPYITVVKAAVIPSLLYYIPLFLAVHFWGRRYHISSLSTDSTPLNVVYIMSAVFLSVISLIIFLLLMRYSPSIVGVLATAAAVILMIFVPSISVFLRSITCRAGLAAFFLSGANAALLLVMLAGGLTYVLAPNQLSTVVVWTAAISVACLGAIAAFGLGARERSQAVGAVAAWLDIPLPTRRGLLDGLVEGVTIGMRISVALACVGLVAQTAISTGLSVTFLRFLEAFGAGSHLMPLLVTMVATIVLGLGMPPVAAYGLVAVIVAPGLVQLGYSALSVHMFIFFFGVLAAVTPPIALGALTAASIAGANYMRTSIVAFSLALPGFIIPFVFISRPEILTWSFGDDSRYSLPIAVGLLIVLTTAIHGHFRTTIRAWERIVLCLTALGALWHLVVPSPALLWLSVGTFLALALARAALLWHAGDSSGES